MTQTLVLNRQGERMKVALKRGFHDQVQDRCRLKATLFYMMKVTPEFARETVKRRHFIIALHIQTMKYVAK